MRKLNQDTAGVLARVQRGETVEITSRGRPVARLVPIEQHPLAPLIATGRVRASTRALDLTVTPQDIAAASGDPEGGIAAVVRQDRDERP